jgi:hypothetical protein
MDDIKYKGLIIKIEHDEFADSPREWDNLGTMICFHRKYTLGDEQKEIDKEVYYKLNEKTGIEEEVHCGSWDDIKEQIEYKYGELAIILPLGLYDHSGITMYVGNDHDRWDGGQVGFIFVTEAQIKKEYGVLKVTKEKKELAESVLRSEVEIYDQYLRGDIWGYRVVDNEDEDAFTFNSVWGFYGTDEAIAAAKEAVDYYIANEKPKARNKSILHRM